MVIVLKRAGGADERLLLRLPEGQSVQIGEVLLVRLMGRHYPFRVVGSLSSWDWPSDVATAAAGEAMAVAAELSSIPEAVADAVGVLGVRVGTRQPLPPRPAPDATGLVRLDEPTDGGLRLIWRSTVDKRLTAPP